jgi:hypothetical protein
LVAIAKINTTPLWCVGDCFIRPSAIGEVDDGRFLVQRGMVHEDLLVVVKEQGKNKTSSSSLL